MLKKFTDLKKHHQLFFSLIIMSGMICMWRGVWGLLDMFLFTGSPLYSYSLSFIIGVGVICLMHYTIDKIV
jgi:hypothetical protein